MTEYRATVRRPGRVFFLLVLSLAGFGVGIWQAIIVENYHDAGRIMAFVLPATVIAIGLSAANGFRRHCWRLEAGGISIREGPSVPLTGLSRSFFVAWSEIASLEMSGEYALRELHLILRNGQAFRIAQKMVPNPMSQFQMPDPDALLDDLEAAIRVRVAAVHPGLPETAQTLSFLETRLGLAILSLGFLISLPMAVFTIWMLWEGGYRTQHTRNNSMALALFIFGPPVTGWALVKKWRARRAILNESGKSAPGEAGS